MSAFYKGSRFLDPLALSIHVPLDQVNFFVCTVVSCFLGTIYRLYFCPSCTSSKTRHVLCLAGGTFMSFFCFGYQAAHLYCLSGLGYFILAWSRIPLSIGRPILLILSLAYLAVCHATRQYLDYGGYTLDITGPLMILVQRITSIAFNLHDGLILKRNPNAISNQNHKRHAIYTTPTLLEYFSYCINFQTVMVGPFVFYADYLRFVEGREREYCEANDEMIHIVQKRHSYLFPKGIVLFYLVSAAIHGGLYKLVGPYFPITYFISNEFRERSIFYKLAYLMTASQLLRQQYYLGWSLATLSCLFSGLGFCGFEKNGKASYKIVISYDWFGIEYGSSFKIMTDSWNKTTSFWLRECVYDRLRPKYATIATFVVSAVWHGFYPGYYLLFSTGALLTQAWRVGRRYVRPFIFPNNKEEAVSPIVRYGYHTLTTLLSIFSLNYAAVPFVMLYFSYGVQFWIEYYFIGHIMSLMVLLLFPKLNFLVSLLTRQRRSSSKFNGNYDSHCVNGNGDNVWSSKTMKLQNCDTSPSEKTW